MSQIFRTHRLFQLLSWSDALSRGYDAPDGRRRPAENILTEDPHRMPTVSNLAYYLLTETEYTKGALKNRFSRRAVSGTPNKNVFTYVKRGLTRHLAQYPGGLSTTTIVKKTAEDHPTFDADIESRCVEAKAYYPTKRGQKRLAELSDKIQFKQSLISTKKTKTIQSNSIHSVNKTHMLSDDAVSQVDGAVESKAIKTDSITVPIEKRSRMWETTTYRVPHVAVANGTRDQTLTVYRD